MLRTPVLGEFMGTLMMILLGDGVVAAVLLRRTKAENAGWLVITAGWCFAVMCGIFTANLFGSPDAHLNPAITLAFGIKEHNFAKLLPYLLAQLAGAIAAPVGFFSDGAANVLYASLGRGLGRSAIGQAAG